LKSFSGCYSIFFLLFFQIAGVKVKEEKVEDDIPEWKKALLERKAKGQHQ